MQAQAQVQRQGAVSKTTCTYMAAVVVDGRLLATIVRLLNLAHLPAADTSDEVSHSANTTARPQDPRIVMAAAAAEAANG